MTSSWLDPNVNANHFKPTYVEGFIDISGGYVQIRNSGNLYVDGQIMENSVYLEINMQLLMTQHFMVILL